MQEQKNPKETQRPGRLEQHSRVTPLSMGNTKRSDNIKTDSTCIKQQGYAYEPCWAGLMNTCNEWH